MESGGSNEVGVTCKEVALSGLLRSVALTYVPQRTGSPQIPVPHKFEPVVVILTLVKVEVSAS